MSLLKKLLPPALAIFSGWLSSLAFPQANVGILIWLSLVPLFFALEEQDLVRSFILGYLAGFTMSLGQFWWLHYAHPAIPFIASTLFATYVGFFGLLYRFIRAKMPFSPLLIIPIVWVAMEFSRTFGVLAFPVGLLGYSQYQFLPVIQIADIGGIYGLSFLIALSNAAIFMLIKNYFSHLHVLRSIVIVIGIFAVILGYGAYRINQFGHPQNLNFKLSIIQPNIDYYSKSYNAFDALDIVDQLTAQAAAENPDLIVWPEAIIKGPSLSDPKILEKVFKIVNIHDNYILYGTPRVAMLNGASTVFSSAILKSPKGKELGIYNKHQLVPFADTLTSFISAFGVSRGIFPYSPGTDYNLLSTPKATFATTICFDGLFPNLVSQLASSGAQFLVNLADDSWSESATEHYQHASMSIFRAVENRIYYARSANSGISMVIDPLGRPIKSLSPFTRGVITANIGTVKTTTYYNRYGDFVAQICFSLTLIFAGMMTLIGLAEIIRGKTVKA